MNQEDAIYDAAVTAAQQSMQAQQARVGFALAADTDADAYAEAKRVARRTGVPVDAVLSNPQGLKLQDKVGAVDFEQLAKVNPITAGILADVEMARLAHDDVEPMSRFESLMRNTGRLTKGSGQALATAIPRFNKGAYGLLQYGAELLPESVGGGVARFAAEQAAANQATIDRWMPQAQGEYEQAWYSGMASTGTMAVNVAMAPFTGGSSLTLMGLGAAGDAYHDARAQGVGEGQAAMFAAGQGMVEAGTETLSFGALKSMIKPSSAFGKKALEYILKEQVGEQIATHLQDLNEWAVLHPEKTLEDYFRERPNAAFQTALSTAFASGAQAGVIRSVQFAANKMQGKQQLAEQAAELVQGINQVAAASKVAQRSPEDFAAFAQAVADENDNGTFYIDANALLQTGVAEQVAQLSPAVAEQLQEAAQTGGQIAIPAGEYAASLARSEYASQLADHVKIAPDDWSKAEAQEWMQSGEGSALQREMDYLLSEKQADEAFRASGDVVRETIKSQLSESSRFTQQANDSYAALASSFYAVQAAKMGVTPEELYQQYPLKVVSEGVARNGYDQPAWHGTPHRGIEKTGFQLNKIGTGEGNQDEGWGMYFASQKAVAEWYRQRLSKTPSEIFAAQKQHDSIAREVSKTQRELDAGGYWELRNSNGVLQGQSITPKESAQGWSFAPFDSRKMSRLRSKMKKLQGQLHEAAQKVDELQRQSQGQLYSLELPDDLVLLDWDQPIAKQAPEVRRAMQHLSQEWSAQAMQTPDEKTGKDWYRALAADLSGSANASNALLGAGIKGLRYLDQFSRGNGEGSHNYVIWDESLLTPEAAQIQAYYQRASQGWLDGSSYNPPSEALTTQQEQLIVDTFNEHGAGEKVAHARDVQESGDIYAKSRAFQALAQSEGWHIAPGTEGDKYFLLGSAPFNGSWGDAITIPVRVSDHSNVNKGHHFKESAINLAPDDGGAYDTFESALWKLRNAGEDENFNLTFAGEEATYFQRSQETKVAYEARIDELFAGEKPSLEGVRVLDGSDMLGLLGMGDGPVYLAEGKVKTAKHPNMGADVWKKIPQWLDNPAAVFDSDTVQGRLVAVAPETINGNAVLMVLEPYGQTKADGVRVHLLQNAYDKDESVPPFGRWLREGKGRYVDQKKFPVILHASGLQLSGTAWQNKPGMQKILTEKNLAGYRKERDDVLFARQQPGVTRGFFDPSSNTIGLLKDADLSTFLHEAGHFFLEMQVDLASRVQQEASLFGADTNAEGQAQIAKDMQILLDWFGVRDLAEWHNMDLEQKRSYHEQFARGFEAYLYEGKAPSLELQGLFRRFSAWLVRVYRDLRNLNVELSDEVRGVFDRMLASSEQIALAEQGRSMMPMFESAQDAGMTPKEFADYQALGMQATAEAIEQLRTRGLRDMQWLRNARSKELKRLQKESRAARADMQMQASREVMQQPIYRAWQFLTNHITEEDQIAPMDTDKPTASLDESRDSLLVAVAKLGGLNRDEVAAAWGIDPKERVDAPVFGKPVLRKTRGMSIDAMGEALAERGYLRLDEHGRFDVRDLEEAFLGELRGEPRYSIAYDYSRQEMRAGDQVPNPAALGAGRFDMGELGAMGLPAEVVQTIKARRMTASNGLHPDIVADLFGFDSGDALVRALASVDSPVDAIANLTDALMLEKHGDLATPEALERAADDAIHNAARMRFTATEANALARAVGRRGILTSAAKEYAQTLIARQLVRNVRPGQYAHAEARAARAADKARRGGNLAVAAAEKRNQLIQQQAARAAHDALAEVDKGLRYLKKFEGDIKGMEADYAEQIHGLLERFDLRRGQSLKAIDQRKSLAEWIKAQREAGLEPDIAPELENEAFRQSYKDMSVEEFRALLDAVKQIEHLGRHKHKLLTAEKQRSYEAVRDEVAAGIREHAHGRKAVTRTPTTKLGKWLQGLKNFGVSHIKVASWARIMDGDKDGGPVWEYFIRQANVRGDMETTMRAEATQKLSAILAPVLKLGRMGGKGVWFESIGRSLNREERLAIALNMGNEGNMQRLLGGENWTLQQVMPVLQSLTATEWQAVQNIWNHFESYREQIAAKERRVYGKEPQWVEPRPLTVTTADGQTMEIQGGYYPIKYDPVASMRAENHDEAEAAKRQMQGAYTSATTRRSFTKSRVAEVKGRPLLYSLTGVYSGVNDVIHDLAWHEWLIDTNRLLKSNTIDAAMREHYGPEVKQQFKQWVQDIAEGDRGTNDAVESALGWMRQSVSVAGLGFNVMSAAMQPLGLTQSIVRVGAKWVGRGISKYIAHPIDLTKRVNSLSAFMENRARTRFRELNELRNQVQEHSAVKDWIGRNAYILMMRTQQMVDVPTWWGAYEKAMAEGNDEARAIALADQAVIDAQGGGQTKDLAAVERGGAFKKIFTTFYSFMNTALNLGVVRTMSAHTPAQKARLAVDYLMLYVVPAVLGEALRAGLTPGDSDDFEDPEKLAQALTKAQLEYLLGLTVVGREFGVLSSVVGDGPVFGYQGPGGLRPIADATKLAQQAKQGEFDEAFLRASINLAGSATGIPSAQINRSFKGYSALSEGDTENPAALIFGYEEPR